MHRSRRFRRSGIAIAIATVLALAVVLGGSPASADDAFDHASSSSAPPQDAHCTSVGSVRGCFREYGDSWWLYNPSGTGRVYIKWWNWLYSSSRTWELHRMGMCFSDDQQGWAKCNKDYYEMGTVNKFGDEGSRLEWYVCKDSCSLPQLTYNHH
ncbi:hypothetical protein [Bailinhaonella thermotolerans]|uniref:Secreted protein n=1 Tax=Bailinhaonella thermotolerans TaxID=1070861 RepID=A0A3A4AZ59_9ACTN|nr:hypothetical protein [Bailinhaonella thermotolerans]RJL35667.1 hypothetical protein D5H75_02445 [Bailinhaonella thermotolerans]